MIRTCRGVASALLEDDIVSELAARFQQTADSPRFQQNHPYSTEAATTGASNDVNP